MENILREVELTLNARFFYAAIALALVIPDACAALASADGETSKAKYMDWYTQNLAAKYSFLSASDFWFLRCATLHQYRFEHRFMHCQRVVFSLLTGTNRTHHNLYSGVLVLQAEQFCRDIVEAARAWFARNQNDANVQKNLPAMAQFRPQGFRDPMAGIVFDAIY